MWLEYVDHEGQAVKGHVDIAHAFSHPYAHANAKHNPNGYDQKHQLGIVQSDGEIAVAKCLESGNLLALQVDQAADNDVQKKGGNTEEDDGENRCDGLLLLQLF